MKRGILTGSPANRIGNLPAINPAAQPGLGFKTIVANCHDGDAGTMA